MTCDNSTILTLPCVLGLTKDMLQFLCVMVFIAIIIALLGLACYGLFLFINKTVCFIMCKRKQCKNDV